MKITIEIEDTLQDCVDSAIKDVKTKLLSYLEQNPDTNKCPDFGNDLDYSRAIHEIIDGSVPIYTAEIDDIFYLHGKRVERAFDDAGLGTKEDSGGPMGWKAAAISCYIEAEVSGWWNNNAEGIFTEWKNSKTTV